jgi:murein DD-endopeptidase MepM/ murein hydrolase activator NlpD
MFKKGVKKLSKWLLVWLAPYLIPIGLVLLIAVFVYMSYMAVYIQLTGGKGSEGATITYLSNTPLDKTYRQWVEYTLGPKYVYADDPDTDDINISDMWVREEGEAGYIHVDDYKHFLGHTKGFLDVNRKDEELAPTFGQVYSFLVYENGSLNKKINKKLVLKVAKDIHPTFKYTHRKSHTHTVYKDGKTPSSDYDSYSWMLDDADTILGHFHFQYKLVTETDDYPNCTVTLTYWQFDGVSLVGNSRWDRINEYLKKEFNVTDASVDIDRQSILEGAKGFDENEMRIEWLARNGFDDDPADFISGIDIPPEYRPFIEEAAQKYHIPDWFIAAVIQRESSFNWLSLSNAGAAGLMQLMPDTFSEIINRVNADFGTNFTVKDIYNPRANILAGTAEWAELFNMYNGGADNIDWKGDGWKDQTLRAGRGYNAGPGNATGNWLPGAHEYMDPLIKYAEAYKGASSGEITDILPVQSKNARITASFHERRPNEIHQGVDIGGVPVGTPIISVSNGRAVVGWDENGYGNYVVIQSAQYNCLYGHMSKVFVRNGEMVKAGQEIGELGSSGRSTGPHLHFGISRNTGENWNTGWIDPGSVVRILYSLPGEPENADNRR